MHPAFFLLVSPQKRRERSAEEEARERRGREGVLPVVVVLLWVN